MTGHKNRRISLNLPSDLAARLNELAAKHFMNRGEIIRLALAEYVNRPENDLRQQAATRRKLTELNKEELDRIRAKYPRNDPNNIELLMVLSEYDQQHAGRGEQEK